MRNVVGSVRSLIVLSLVLGLALPAQAILKDRGSFSYTDGVGNTGMVNLIYDQDLDITWVGDANLAKTSGFDADGLLPWQQAVDWAAGLTIGGMNNWRLPTTTQPDPTCSVQQGGGVSIGDGCTGSEMGHLYHTALGNAEGGPLTNAGPFINIQLASSIANDFYWSGTPFGPPFPSRAYFFRFNIGNQGARNKTFLQFAWAVHDGDVIQTVAIDIKPGNDSNTINVGSAGVVPVAILSSATFDALTVDPDTISLAGASVKMVGKSDKALCHEQDVNGDLLIDLVCKIETVQFIIEEGATTAILEGMTVGGGQPIRGEDTIRIVPD